MKTYDETIDAIFSKGDALIEQRRERSAMIKHTSYAVSGLCAATIVGVGIWRITNHGKMPDNGSSEIETVEDATTDTQNETYTTTSTPVSDKEKAKNTTSSTSKNTVVSSAKTTTAKSTTKGTTQSAIKTEITESTSKETTNTQTEKAATADTTTITTSQFDTTTRTTIAPASITTIAPNEVVETTTQFTDDITRQLPSIFNTLILTETDSLDSKMREQKFIYSYHNFKEDEIVGLLKEIHLNVNFDGNDYERDANIYEIKGHSADAMIAVKFEGRDDYFLYCNQLYAPETLGEFISAFSLDSDNYIRECYRGNVKADDITPQKAWNLLTADRLLPDVTDSCKGKYFAENDRIWITSVNESDQWLSIKIGVDPQGYIVTDTNTAIPDRYFYIGEDRAAEIIGYCKLLV